MKWHTTTTHCYAVSPVHLEKVQFSGQNESNSGSGTLFLLLFVRENLHLSWNETHL